MKETIENKLLDDLYEIRCNGIEVSYIKKFGKCEEIKKAQDKQDAATNLIKQKIEDEGLRNEILKKFEEAYESSLGEMCFWEKMYYKKGLVDGIVFTKEIDAEKEKYESDSEEESIIYQNIYEILDYIEQRKYENLKSDADYNDIKKEIKSIKEKYPRVNAFFYDHKIVEFTEEEMRAILEITELNENRCMIEADEMFKIGLREGKAL